LAFKDWGNLFHNAAAASAIADRLFHKGLIIRIAGKSRRSDQEVEYRSSPDQSSTDPRTTPSPAPDRPCRALPTWKNDRARSERSAALPREHLHSLVQAR